jgi:RHS repeat-associated protein
MTAPGHGVQAFTYDPDTGHLQRTTAPDGVVATVANRDPESDALLDLIADRGPGGVLVSSFRYDGMERLATGWSDFGGSSAEEPLQSIAYQFPTSDFPGLVQIDTLVDAAAGTRQESASWSYPDGTELARATRIPGRWVFDGVSAIERAELRTRGLRRAPLVDSADLAAQTYDSLRAETVELSDDVMAGFGHTVTRRDLIQQGAVREVVSAQSLADGLLVTTSRENGALETRRAVDVRGLPSWVSDQVGSVTRYEYDVLGRLVEVLLPDGARQRLSFDSFGRPAMVTRDGVGTVAYSYQPNTGLLDRKEYRDTAGVLERTVELEYDAIGRVRCRVHVKPAGGEERRFTFRYDGETGSGEPMAGQRGYTTQVQGPAYTRTSAHNPDGTEASSSIDLAGWMRVDLSSTYYAGGALKEAHRVITRLSDGAVIEDVVTGHIYDEWGRLGRIVVDGQELANIHYDNDGRIAWVDVAGGQRIDHIYDPATLRQSGYTQEVSGESGAWQTGVEWELNARGLVEREAIGLADQTWLRTYGYDPRGFLISAEDAGQLSTYAYSATGYPERIEDERGARVLRRGKQRAMTVADIPYDYDASGRVTARGEATFKYGPDGHLSVAQVGARTLVYHYDADGNRLLKYEAGLPVAAYLGGGYLTDDTFISPVKIGGRVIGVLENGAFRMLATDPRGTLLADQDGTPRLASPFGVRTNRPDLSEALDYVEKSYDADTGSVRMGVRDYDPLLGQFWTPDPLFLETIDKCAESPVECNLYSYARNNPLTFVDPDGTEGKVTAEGAAEVVFFGRAGFDKKGPVDVQAFAVEVKTQNGTVMVEANVAKLGKTVPFENFDGSFEGEVKVFGVEGSLGLKAAKWSLVAVEVKAAGQAGPLKAGVSFGVAAGGGWKWGKGKMKLEIKLIVGFELEIDAWKFLQWLDRVQTVQMVVPKIILRGTEETSMSYRSVSYVEAPPPEPKLKPMRRPKPKPQAPRYGSCADPDSPPPGPGRG